MSLNWMDFIRIFAVDKNETASVKQDSSKTVEATDETVKQITNEDILNYVTAHFEKEMKDKSFHNVVTFPMSFTVILNRKDYERFAEYCRVVSKHIVLNFYRIIKEELAKGKEKVCEPLATYWNVSFLQCDNEPLEVNGCFVQVDEGDYCICSCVYDKLSEQVKNRKGGSTISVSKGGSRLFANVNINPQSLENLRIVNETHIQMDWDRRMSDVFEFHGPVARHHDGSLGRLVGNGYIFRLDKGVYRVSGSEETVRDKNVLIVDSDFVENGHVQLEYIASEDKFKMAAFADTKLNGKPLPLSDAGDKRWIDLNDGDNMNLADDVILTFKRNY